jgi:hypothetical protein
LLANSHPYEHGHRRPGRRSRRMSDLRNLDPLAARCAPDGGDDGQIQRAILENQIIPAEALWMLLHSQGVSPQATLATSPLVSSARENCWNNTAKRTLHKRPRSWSVAVFEAHSSLKLHSPLPVTANGHRFRSEGLPVTSGQFLVSAPTAAYCGSFLSRPAAPRFAKAFPAYCSRRPGDLPVGRIMLGFGHRRDVFGGIAWRQESRPPGTTMGSMNRLNQTTGRTGIIVSDVKRQQS